jgi:hypothetical protein
VGPQARRGPGQPVRRDPRRGHGRDADTAVGLVGALGWYWWLRSLKTEGAELAGEALAIAGRAADEDGTERLALAYTVGALLAGDASRSESAMDWFRTAAELAASVPDPRIPLLRLVGPIRAMFGSVIDGVPASPDAFDQAVDDADAWVAATARVLRGHMTLNNGRLHAQAETDFLRAADTFGALGERWGRSAALGGLGSLEAWRGEHAGRLRRRAGSWPAAPGPAPWRRAGTGRSAARSARGSRTR